MHASGGRLYGPICRWFRFCASQGAAGLLPHDTRTPHPAAAPRVDFYTSTAASDWQTDFRNNFRNPPLHKNKCRARRNRGFSPGTATRAPARIRNSNFTSAFPSAHNVSVQHPRQMRAETHGLPQEESAAAPSTGKAPSAKPVRRNGTKSGETSRSRSPCVDKRPRHAPIRQKPQRRMIRNVTAWPAQAELGSWVVSTPGCGRANAGLRPPGEPAAARRGSSLATRTGRHRNDPPAASPPSRGNIEPVNEHPIDHYDQAAHA